MRKDDMLEKLKQLKLEKDSYIIMGKASLILQDAIEEDSEDFIYLTCSNDKFNQLDWEYKIGLLGMDSKEFDGFIMMPSFYNTEKMCLVDSYYVSDLESTFDFLKRINSKKDKKIIEKLDLLLCSLDSYRYERKLKEKGIKLIAGVDEVGRGPLVGPVVAACCILPDDFQLDGLTDSKKLSEKKRNFYFEEIKRQAVCYGIGIIDCRKIDEVNIYEATKLAMKEAINNMKIKPEHILIDAMPLDISIPTTSIIKGDLKSITISAASVLAKVTRDRMLDDLDQLYPVYDFKSNKGYPTKKHLEAIEKYGIIDEHRRSYGPVKDYLEGKIDH